MLAFAHNALVVVAPDMGNVQQVGVRVLDHFGKFHDFDFEFHSRTLPLTIRLIVAEKGGGRQGAGNRLSRLCRRWGRAVRMCYNNPTLYLERPRTYAPPPQRRI